mgnify:CR=1 FL=1
MNKPFIHKRKILCHMWQANFSKIPHFDELIFSHAYNSMTPFFSIIDREFIRVSCTWYSVHLPLQICILWDWGTWFLLVQNLFDSRWTISAKKQWYKIYCRCSVHFKIWDSRATATNISLPDIVMCTINISKQTKFVTYQFSDKCSILFQTGIQFHKCCFIWSVI